MLVINRFSYLCYLFWSDCRVLSLGKEYKLGRIWKYLYTINQWLTVLYFRGVSRIFFNQGANSIFRGAKIFSRSPQRIVLFPSKKIMPFGITNKRGKERLLLASAPFEPHEIFCHKGQKHTFSNFIRSIYIYLQFSPKNVDQTVF